jgi:hypothetical protein
MWQGGGATSTYPWELWRYRHLDEIGENIELEFVDPSGSGEYHLKRDPGRKRCSCARSWRRLGYCRRRGKVGNHAACVLTFFGYVEAHWRALERPRLEF